MAQKERQCMRCKENKPMGQFKNTPSPFFPAHRSLICTSCLEEMVPAENLDKVDKLMQYMDLPFDANEWTKLYEVHKEHTLSAYFNRIADERYSDATWATENERWRLARSEQTIEEQMEVFSKAEIARLRRKWSEYYTVDELRYLENYYNQIVATQNVSTPILREYACDLCELELQIKKGVRNSEDVKKLMDARDNIIRIAKFEANNSKNAADFDTIGEVLSYYVKKGWRPNWHTEPKDSVDFCMQNIQKFLQRLVKNEGNFADQVEDRREAFNLTERLSKDEDIDTSFDVEAVEIEYEDEKLLDGELDG